jgi:hypothetical protein
MIFKKNLFTPGSHPLSMRLNSEIQVTYKIQRNYLLFYQQVFEFQ